MANFEDADKAREMSVIKTYNDLHRWQGHDVTVHIVPRIVQIRTKRFFDIREYQVTSTFCGYTKRGLRFSLLECERLLAVLPKAIAFLKGEIECERSATSVDKKDGISQPS